jgi:hypothetical protein
VLNKHRFCTHAATSMRYLLALALIVATSAADAAIYKWVDDKGVTHYSEQPPPGKKKPEPVPIRSQPVPAASQGPQGTSDRKTWQQQEAEFQQRRVEREMQRKKRETQEQSTAAARLRRCVLARQNLHGLEEKRPVYRINEKGERVFFDDKERQQALERMREVVADDCDGK